MAVSAASLRLLIDSRGAAAGAASFKASTMIIVAATMMAVKTLADFEEKMTLVKKVTGATAQEFEVLTNKARHLGAVTRFTATEAADGMLRLARAGFSVKESLDAVQDSLDLATAGGLGMGEATGFMSASIRQFSLDATEAARVAHALTDVSNNTNTDIRQLAEALKYAGTVMATTGADIEETAAAIGILGNRGIQGSMAGTQLRGAFLALSAPTKRVNDGLAALNLTYDQVNPATNTLVEIAESLALGFNSLANPADAAGIAVRIFGRRNMTAGVTLAQNVELLKAQIQATKDSNGAHTDLARAMEQTIIGKFKALISVIQEVILIMGDSGLNWILKTTMGTLTEMLRIFADVDDSFRKGSVAAKAFTMAIVGASAAMVVLRYETIYLMSLMFIDFIVTATTGLWLMVTATGALSAAFVTLGAAIMATPIGWIAAAVAALAAGVYYLYQMWSDESEAAERSDAQLKNNADTAKRTAESYALLAQMVELGSEAWGKAEQGSNRAEQYKSAVAAVSKAKVEAKKLADTLKSLKREIKDSNGELEITQGLLAKAFGDKDMGKYFVRTMSNASGVFATWTDNTIEAALAMMLINKEIKRLDDLIGGGLLEDMTGLKPGEGEYIEWAEDLKRLHEDYKKLAVFTGDVADETKRLAMIRELEKDMKIPISELKESYQVELEGLLKNNAELEKSVELHAKLKAQKLSDLAYLETLALENEILLMRISGEGELADVMQLLLSLKQRGIDVSQGLGAEIFDEAMLNKALNGDLEAQIALQRQLNKVKTKSTNRGSKRIENWLGNWEEEKAVFEVMKDNVNLSADAFELAAEKAKIFAEAQRLLADATAEEAAKIIEARDAMMLYSEEVAKFEDQREMVLGVQVGIEDMFNSVINGSMTAGEAFKKFIDGLIKDLIRAMLKKLVFDKLFGMLGGGMSLGGGMGMGGGEGGGGGLNLGGGGGWAALGKAFNHGNELTKFAHGGVVNSPTYFGTNQGVGLMGEAGAEAILPLTRGKGGKLGVQSSGQGAKIININMTVNTPDADSFRKSRIQIQNDLRRQTTNLTDDFK